MLRAGGASLTRISGSPTRYQRRLRLTRAPTRRPGSLWPKAPSRLLGPGVPVRCRGRFLPEATMGCRLLSRNSAPPRVTWYHAPITTLHDQGPRGRGHAVGWSCRSWRPRGQDLELNSVGMVSRCRISCLGVPCLGVSSKSFRAGAPAHLDLEEPGRLRRGPVPRSPIALCHLGLPCRLNQQDIVPIIREGGVTTRHRSGWPRSVSVGTPFRFRADGVRAHTCRRGRSPSGG